MNTSKHGGGARRPQTRPPRWRRIGAWLLAVSAGGMAAVTVAVAAERVIYDDALSAGFQNWSYGGGSDFAHATTTHMGSAHSIAFTGQQFNAVSFAHPAQALQTSDWPTLRLWVHGGSSGGQQLRLVLQNNGVVVAQAELDSYIQGGALQAGQWRAVLVPFANPPLAYTGPFNRIDLQADQAASQPTLYIDDVALLGGDDRIFVHGFETVAGGLLIERDVVVDGMSSERFSWIDSAGLPRVAVFAHNNGQTGPGGSRGGELRELRYQTPTGTRIVRAPPSGAGGFGYVVAHADDGNAHCTGGGDTSSLGHFTPGQFQRLFEGRHHVILRFTQAYPRYCTTTAPATQYNVPVTIDWLISSGRDHPLWSVSFDMNNVPANALRDDARAPYGELLFDGAASAGAHSVIAGVGWGDRYRFTSTSAPLSYNSSWTWNTPNTIPYVKLWTTAVDATMASVQTRPITQQDAGGYFGVNRWNTTSAAGNACTIATGGVNTLMPCNYNWPFQSVNYSMNPFANPNGNTNNTRLAWGSNVGFLGQQQYRIHGSQYYGGPLPDTFASGWPRQSYSVHVVLGRHSVDPVGAQVGQVEVAQQVGVSASVGTVAVNGPAGVNRPDLASYVPAGYDHVYAAWTFAAAGNRLDATMNVAGGALRHPLLVLRNYTTAQAPALVRLGETVLVADQDYYASVRPEQQQLWLTLNRDLAVGSHRIRID